MSIPYIDFHTHRDYSNADTISVRSYRAGIEHITADCEHPIITAGIHPWDCDKVNVDQILQTLKSSTIAAIGEIGLDRRCGVDIDLQRHVFESQLHLAQENNLPVVLHCVRAIDETLKILSNYTLKNIAFHSFIGNVEQLAKVFDHGYYISLSSLSLNSTKTVDAISKLHNNNIFIETDDYDCDIKSLYKTVSKMLNINTKELKEIPYNNYIQFFK